MILGFDVSKWEDNNSTPQKINFKIAKASGIEFVYIKSSQSTWIDEDFLYNWKSAQDEKILRGAYHFLTWDNPEAQAQFFSGLLKPDMGELPPVVDFEWWGNEIPKNALDIIWRFISELKKTITVDPIIYTAPSFWNQYGSNLPSWEKYKLWIAHYNVSNPTIPPPWKKWTFWQYTAKGDGIKYGCESKEVDLDYFNGTREELINLKGTYQIFLPGIIQSTEDRITNLEKRVTLLEKR